MNLWNNITKKSQWMYLKKWDCWHSIKNHFIFTLMFIRKYFTRRPYKALTIKEEWIQFQWQKFYFHSTGPSKIIWLKPSTSLKMRFINLEFPWKTAMHSSKPLQPPPDTSCQIVHLLSAPELASWVTKGEETSIQLAPSVEYSKLLESKKIISTLYPYCPCQRMKVCAVYELISKRTFREAPEKRNAPFACGQKGNNKSTPV